MNTHLKLTGFTSKGDGTIGLNTGRFVKESSSTWIVSFHFVSRIDVRFNNGSWFNVIALFLFRLPPHKQTHDDLVQFPDVLLTNIVYRNLKVLEIKILRSCVQDIPMI